MKTAKFFWEFFRVNEYSSVFNVEKVFILNERKHFCRIKWKDLI